MDSGCSIDGLGGGLKVNSHRGKCSARRPAYAYFGETLVYGNRIIQPLVARPEIPALRLQPPQPGRKVNQPIRNQVVHHPIALPNPFHGQHARLQQRLALSLPHAAPRHYPDRVELVLQRNKDAPLGRGRLLPQRHDACGAHHAIVGHPLRLPRGISFLAAILGRKSASGCRRSVSPVDT